MSDERRTPTHPIRAPKVMWQAWGRVTDRLGTDRTARVLDLLRADIAEHGDDQDREALAIGEKELAERRARMHPGRPPRQPGESSAP